MIVPCLVALIIGLHAGDVISVPPSTALVVPGKLNWVLHEPTFEVAPGTRAIVVRVAPEHLIEVVEIRLFDGTDRSGWLEDDGLTSVRAAFEYRGRALPVGMTAPSGAAKSYGVVVNPKLGRRPGHLPDFSAVDAFFAEEFHGEMTSGSPSFSPSARSHICGKPNTSKPGVCQRRVAAGGACPEHGA